MNLLKNQFNRASCKHFQAELIRWHWTHGDTAMEPRKVEVEYKCSRCGKTVYMHLDWRESCEWEKVMGHHKQDGYKEATQ